MKKTLIVFAFLISQFATATVLSARKASATQNEPLNDMEIKAAEMKPSLMGWQVILTAQEKEGQIFEFNMDFKSYIDASAFAVNAAKSAFERVSCKLESDVIALDIQNPCHLDDIVVRSATLP